MNVFTLCDNARTYKCSGEVQVLIRAADRYGGFLTEKARTRIETICASCKNFSSRARNGVPERAQLAR